MKKRTIFIWIIIILLGLSVLAEAYGLFLTDATMLVYGMSLVTIITYSILAIKLYKLAKDSIKWTHIVFVWTAIGMIYNLLVVIIPNDKGPLLATLLTNITFWGLFVLIWVLFTKHLKKVLNS